MINNYLFLFLIDHYKEPNKKFLCFGFFFAALEKRIFYFLCLIRNGVQVLQTQVISVKELAGTRDTFITFPNRMAISNVDINFKVKIDVYCLVNS